MKLTNLVQTTLVIVDKWSGLSWSVDKDDVLGFNTMYYSQR